MRHINGVYTQRYNRRKRTDGPLFRGRYKAILIDEDAYLLQVGRYIHRNPLEVKGASSSVLNTFRHSSYLAYVNKIKAPVWLERHKTYQMLGRRDRYTAYRSFVQQGNDIETEQFYNKDNVSSIFGDKSFRKSILEDKDNLQVSAELPKALSRRPEIAQIVQAVAEVFKISEDKILRKQTGRQMSNTPRQVAMYCSQQLGDHSLRSIAEHFSLSHPGSVSQSVNSIMKQLERKELSIQLKKLEKILDIIK